MASEGISGISVFFSLFIIAGCLATAYYFLIYKKTCPPSTGCAGICTDSCKNGGTWNPTTKTCLCPTGWTGIDCGVQKNGTPTPNGGGGTPPAGDTCGFHPDIVFPTGTKCGYGINGKTDGELLGSYCGFFNQHTDWFDKPDEALKIFGVNTQADYANICKSPSFQACSPDIQAKGIQHLFKTYSKGKTC